ncbi:hypothetical protein HanLR1_Chr13g0480181 [Helianthus annuus]|nr:hypothetical protein HanLR1_Chr13g0480181 [Helianthus annuus]
MSFLFMIHLCMCQVLMKVVLWVHVANNMENPDSISGLSRTQSDQLTMKSTISSEVTKEVDRTLSRKSSRNQVLASSGRIGNSGRNTHIKRGKSAQMKFEHDDVGSGAVLSRASSASLGFSFSLAGFTMQPDEIADLTPFSEDDIRKYFMSMLVF